MKLFCEWKRFNHFMRVDTAQCAARDIAYIVSPSARCNDTQISQAGEDVHRSICGYFAQLKIGARCDIDIAPGAIV